MKDKTKATTKEIKNEPINIKFSVVNRREATIPTPTETPTKNGGFVQFGDDNLYSYHLFEYYQNCSILQSIINGMNDYISGVGFADETNDKVINAKGETLYSLLRKISSDYCIFGMFAVQVLKNAFNEITELYWVDVRKIRMNEDCDKVYFNDWQKRRKTPIVYPRWVKNSTEKNSIYIYKNPISRDVYGCPMWGSAIKDVQTFVEISKFHLNNIMNNFSGSAIVNFNNGVPDEQTQREIEKKLNDKFAGSDNAGKTLVSFNDSKESAVTIARLTEDNFDSKYNALYETTRANILATFRATEQLFGLQPKETAFNSVEFTQSFQLYKKVVISPLQREIETFFKDVLNIDEQLREFVIKFEDTNV